MHKYCAKKIFQTTSNAEAPHSNAVGRLIKKFCQTGDVKDASCTGRPSTTNEKAIEIQEMILKNPKKCVGQLQCLLDYPCLV